jgi:TolB protein
MKPKRGMLKRVLNTVFLLAIALILSARAETAGAKIYIDIHSPSARKLPIAIAPFKNLGTTPDKENISSQLNNVLTQDLEISGLFQIIDPKSYIENPQTAGITSDKINWSDWSTIGAEALVKCGFSLDGKVLMLEGRLFDVVQGKFIAGKRYYGKVDDFPLMVHKLVNEIIYQLTGEQSIFETRIAFVSTMTGTKEICLMDVDGENRQRITAHRSICLSPAWSPDGKKLVFTSYKKGNPDLYLKDIIYGSEKVISQEKGLNISPVFSPDGKKIALTLSVEDGNSELFLIDLEGHKLDRLTTNWGLDVSPTFSPDGKRIAFVSDRSGSPQIYVLDVEDKNVKRLTFEGNYNATPEWSPRGDKIAFSRMTGNKFDIYIMDADGNNVQRLTTEGSNEDPSWSPNGRYIAFSSNREGGKKVYIMLANGSNQRRVTSGKGDDTSPVWSPTTGEK